MKRFIFITALSIISSLLYAASGESDAFRCGSWVISQGDTKFEVLSKCGDPDFVEYWEQVRIRRDYGRPRVYEDDYGRTYEEPRYVKEYVDVEEWTYNFGPRKFIRYLRFENGKLRRIRTGDYGY